MNKKTMLIIATMLLLLGSSHASTVTRSLSATTVEPNSNLTVTLTVNITEGETYYAIDETTPSNWTISDPGTATTDEPGHLKWVVIQNATNTTHTYSLTAPAQEETTTLSGTYMFEGMAEETQIGGEKQVSVGSQGPGSIAQPTTDYLTIGIVAIVAIILLVTAYKKTRLKTEKRSFK